MTTIRFNDGELQKVQKGFQQMVERDAWYFSRPFWYKLNTHGTWEVYTTEELRVLADKQPKWIAQPLTSMIIKNGL
jgi:hypothetical protein